MRVHQCATGSSHKAAVAIRTYEGSTTRQNKNKRKATKREHTKTFERGEQVSLLIANKVGRVEDRQCASKSAESKVNSQYGTVTDGVSSVQLYVASDSKKEWYNTF